MPKAELGNDVIVVETVWNEKELVKQIPGARWKPNDKAWHVPLTWEHCVMLRGVFGEALEVGEKLVEWAWPVAMRAHSLAEMRGLLEPEVRKRTDLYPFQEVGSDFLIRTRSTLLGDEMGTGKTVQVCASLTELPALVVCPNSVKRSWAHHIRRWTTATPFIVEGGATGRENILKEAAKHDDAVVIINYDALRTMSRLAPYGSIRLRRCRECDPKTGEEGITAARCQVHPKTLNRFEFKTVVIDEAHKIKNPSALQSRAVWAVSTPSHVRYRWALTGTPIANHPGDLWSILHAIMPNAYPTRTGYVDRYCLQSWDAYGGLAIVGLNPAHREEFFSLLDPHFRRMRKDVVLSQLPPKVRSTRWVEMTPKQKRMYDDFERGLGTVTDEGGTIIAPNSLVAKLRQMQLSSATVVASEDRGPVRMSEPSSKLDALEEILDEMEGKPVAVCAHHRQLIELAVKRLEKRKETYGLITGAVSEYERDKALRDFQEGRIRVLLFTIAAGGVGLTMTASDTLVFLQRSWSMVDNKQAEDRVHRIGAEVHESVHIIDIVTRDSVEEDQIGTLHEKFARLEEIVRDRATRTSPTELAELDREEDIIMRSQL